MSSPGRLVRLVRRAKMSSAGEAFVKTWETLCEYPLPLNHMMRLIYNSGEQAVRDGLTNNPWIIHQLLLKCQATQFYPEWEALEVDVIRLLLDICPEAAGVPVPSDKLDSEGDPSTLVYPLHAACQNPYTQNEVIEMLLEKSTAGLNHMVVVCMGIVEWCGRTSVAGTPLHYYLYWGKGNVAIVERLVEECPEALAMKDMTTLGLTPLHTVLRPPSKPDLEVVKLLVQHNPTILHDRDACGQYPIHAALNNTGIFRNEYITVEVIEFLLENSPDVWGLRDDQGFLPMHYLLQNGAIEETIAIDILHLFQRMAPNESFFRDADEYGRMPIHHATSAGHGAKFCQLLVELAPGCERMPRPRGYIPLYRARHIDTVKYLVGLYPESIYLRNSSGETPFHYAVRRMEGKHKVDILRYYLQLDPTFASKSASPSRGGRREDLLPLQTACIKWDHGIEDWKRAEVVKTLFDFNPSAVLAVNSDGKLPVDLAKDAMAKEMEERNSSFCGPYKEAISFLETQHPFIVEASNSDATLNTPDPDGRLLLHRALLKKNISLGTVRMIVDGTNHAAAVRGPNPLHLACANCAPDIIQYLLGVYPSLATSVDDEGCNILHLVCKGGNLKAVQYLLEQHAPLASQTNGMDLLPLHLLCDKAGKEEIVDGKDYAAYACKKEYVGLVWQLLLAYPEAVSSAVTHWD